MGPFDSVEEAILFGDEQNITEFCCLILRNQSRYTAYIDRRADPLKIEVADFQD